MPNQSRTPQPNVITIRLWPYLRAMAAVFWCSFRYPLQTTYIDLATGRIVRNL